MANVYTDVLASIHSLAEGDDLDFSVPSGFRWIVRNIDAMSGASVDLPELWLVDLVSGGTFLTMQVAGVINESVRWEGRQAFNYGGGFRVHAETNDWDCRVTGYVFAA